MKIDERVNYMRISLGIIGIKVDNFTAELICELNDLMVKKKDSVTLRDIKKLEVNLTAKYMDFPEDINEETNNQLKGNNND
jgi:hypothetical protein